jgi:hypothetical protein
MIPLVLVEPGASTEEALCIGRPKSEISRRSRRASGGPIQISKADGLPCFVSGAPIQRKVSVERSMLSDRLVIRTLTLTCESD